jgi:hypothetical protein
MSGPYLATSLRKQLAKTIDQARKVAEAGAAEAIRRLGVAEADAPTYLNETEGKLRNKLRAHARALGDRRDPSSRTQSVAKLTEATAYEHWHRILFARFLAERSLLIHPMHRAPVSLEDCRELAAEEGLPDAWAVAERYATRMLPGIFRPDDPSLALTLAPNHAVPLRKLVTDIDAAVFAAADSLGWTYQFWRAVEKDAVNRAGGKIGADELPAVTQLFTEPYMVQFLLHNTLGAWWAGKRIAAEPELARAAVDEAALRAAVSLPGIDWDYLRFVQEDGVWRPAAGTFPGWPERAAEITVMDPCCGSGHFLVEALGILAALRIAEEELAPADAVSAVLSDNLFGLEIDGRCVQIAAFAAALAAWRIAGSEIDLPRPHIAWVGQAPAVGKNEWLRLAEGIAAKGPVPPKQDLLGTEENLFSSPDRWVLELLWDWFGHAPVLGSLLDLGAMPPLFAERIAGLEEMLAKAAFGESETDEMALAARGMADAAGMLARRYTLQATNVPYLGRGKQAPALADHLARVYPEAKADLATAMLVRMLKLAAVAGTVAAVTPQNWLFLGSYKQIRRDLLGDAVLQAIVDLGPSAFNDMNWWAARTALAVASNRRPENATSYLAFDADTGRDITSKPAHLMHAPFRIINQRSQLSNPDQRISVDPVDHGKLLSEYANVYVGFQNGDSPQWIQQFWEQAELGGVWSPFQATSDQTKYFAGRDSILKWENGKGSLVSSEQVYVKGREAWGKRGVIVRQTRHLPAGLYMGDLYDQSSSVIIPKQESQLMAIVAFVMSPEFHSSVRRVDPSVAVTNATFVKVPFDAKHWGTIAAQRYPNGLPEPYSDDPTQWLFHGHPAKAEAGTTLQVALAQLAGYRWPAETDGALRLSDEARALVAKAATLPAADADGILCLPPVGGDAPLAERLRASLAAAFGATWNESAERQFLAEAAEHSKEKPVTDLEDWLRHHFFRQHCALFHHRPFLWHIWDGQQDGFAAALQYNRLAKATLQKLTYTVLGDWLARMKDLGDARRLEAARILQQKLELILTGESPYDIFVRWKPLARQPLGWDPDLDDGVRMNIRPFVTAGVLRETPNIKWGKDRGTDVATAPWYHLGPEKGGKPGDRINDHHTTLAEKQAARDVEKG